MEIQDNYFDIKKVQDYCNKEFLLFVYNCYLYNLKRLSTKTKWIWLTEIEDHQLRSWTCIGDKYLEDSKDDKMKLAMDIYENGTYFPIFLKKELARPYILRDGGHRLRAMRLLVEKGFWDESKKIMVATDEQIETEYNKENIFLIPLMVTDEFKANYKAVYEEFFQQENIEYYDENKYFAKFRTERFGYLATACISLLLRNAFFEYKTKYGDVIETSPVINEYEAWKEWRGY